MVGNKATLRAQSVVGKMENRSLGRGAYLESHLSLSMPTSWCRVVVVVTMSSACGFRQALVDHYSKLSAEAARREQKALWRIQRHRLESARLRFLLEDQKRIQVWQWCQLPALAHSYVLTPSCCIRAQMVLAEAQASSQTWTVSGQQGQWHL